MSAEASPARFFRDGAWATDERLRVYPSIFLVFYAIALIGWALTGHGGLRDATERPYFPDFLQFAAAGQLAWTGDAPAIWDFAGHQVKVAPFGLVGLEGYWGFPYPPNAVIFVAWLGFLPYLPGALVWVGATLASAWAVVRRIVPGHPALVFAFPAVFVNAAHGQNGFLTAAAVGGALLALPSQPIVTGLCIGVLAFKPQFGVLIPIALVAGGYGRAFAASTAAVALFVGVSWVAWGTGAWLAFLHSLSTSGQMVVETSSIGKSVTVMSAVRLVGGGGTLASAAQAGATLTVAAAIAWLWSRDVSLDLKCAGLAIAIPLASPYAFDYDLTVFGVGLAFLAREGLRDGFRPWEITMIAAGWLLPLFGRPVAFGLGVPLGAPVLASLLALVLVRARTQVAR